MFRLMNGAKNRLVKGLASLCTCLPNAVLHCRRGKEKLVCAAEAS